MKKFFFISDTNPIGIFKLFNAPKMGLFAGFFLFFSLFFLSRTLSAQKFLVLDRYGTKRLKLREGDKIRFKQKMNNVIFNDHIALLKDTSLHIATSHLEIPLSDFHRLYFRRNIPHYIQKSTLYMGVGFLFSGLISFGVRREDGILAGTGFLLISQSMHFFKWRKYNFNRRARIRIIDTTFR